LQKSTKKKEKKRKEKKGKEKRCRLHHRLKETKKNKR
jgi:hypothetical protein